MKKIYMAALALILSFSPSFAATEWGKFKGEPRGLTLTLEGKKAENLLKVVSNLPWISDGKDAPKQKYLYVLYQPTCSYSQALFKETRKITAQSDIQIRWIPISPDGSLNSLYENRNVETLKEAFENQQIPYVKDTKKSANINAYALSGLTLMLYAKHFSPDGNLYFPTMIYGNSEKTFVTIGPAKDMKKLLDSIPETESTKIPEAISLGATKPELTKIKPIENYKNESGKRVAIRLYPDKNAADIGGLLPGDEWPQPTNSVSKNGFIAFQISTQGSYMFIEDEEFVKRALAEK
ncbi:hypothetical protein WJT86_09885 [Microvirga sp. W0021]|uniref:Uncharacterized protein n=1 Tax=Hohaiivirga grylli TaxID=3133970 RepID=A0ABV0BM62_9HYPH